MKRITHLATQIEKFSVVREQNEKFPKPRAHSVPPARRGNLKEGVGIAQRFYELRLSDW